MNDAGERFEALRDKLIRHAYRMLGDWGESEDAVQEAYVRWSAAAERQTIENDEAFLRTAITRLALDRLRSARARREVYVGPWLPEPVVDAQPGPEAAAVLADDISFALLLACERLSPLERAAFLLHEALGAPFEEIAQTLGVSGDNARQLASRARRHVREARPHQRVTREKAIQLRDAFLAALQNDDASALRELMLSDVVLTADSGGKVPASMVPIAGVDRVCELLLGVFRKYGQFFRHIELASINGMPGMVILGDEGVIQTIALELRDGAIAAMYVTRNPEKLQRIAARFNTGS